MKPLADRRRFLLLLFFMLALTGGLPPLYAATGDDGTDPLGGGPLGGTPSGGGIPLEAAPSDPFGNQQNPLSDVENLQQHHGNECASGGSMSDYSSLCGDSGATNPPPQNPEDGTDCAKNPNAPGCNKNPGKEGREQAGQKTPQEPPPCVAKTREAAQACASQFGAANNACSDSRLAGVQQQAQRNAQSLQGQANVNASCQQETASHRQSARIFSDFAGSCQSAVSACVNACQEMQREANACPDQSARQIAAQYQPQSQNCSGGWLSQRPGQARQQAANFEETARINEQRVCQNTTAATTQQKSSSGPLAQDSSGASGGNLSAGSPDVRGQVPVSSVPETPDTASVKDPAAGGGGRGGAPEENNVLGLLPESHYDGMSSSNSLAALPTRASNAVSEDLEDGTGKKSDQGLSAEGGGGTYGGSRGRRMPLLRPLAKKLSSAGAEDDEAGRRPASAEAFPDLNQFRPRMGGFASKCPAGTFANPGNSKECFHSGNKNIFQVMSEAFARSRQTPGRLINDEP